MPHTTPRPASALLVVPPLLRNLSGPLLGPALLVAAGRAAGHEVRVSDLNAAWLRSHLDPRGSEPVATILGDHGKPAALEAAAAAFTLELSTCFDADPAPSGSNGWLTACASHEEMLRGARNLAAGPAGAWIRERLACATRPDVVGVSLLYSGQVAWGLAVSAIARSLWPQTKVIWGGPHITCLRHEIARDERYGALVDGFVFGSAEVTFAALLDAVAAGEPLPAEVAVAGAGRADLARERLDLVPVFDDLSLYGVPRLTLPVQASRGCPFAQCRFCTYPEVEGEFRRVPIHVIESRVLLAQQVGGRLSFKDSLLTVSALREVASIVAGRVPWDGSTKLHPALDAPLLRLLAQSGCDSLEIGLESLVPETQALIAKHQPPELLGRFLDAARDAGVGVVVNYITGFPYEPPASGGRGLQAALTALEQRAPALRGVLHHNTFQLERLAPLALEAARFGIRVTRSWPWATVLDWEEVRSAGRPAPLAVLP